MASATEENPQSKLPAETNKTKVTLWQYLKEYFDLKKEKENEYETIESLKADVEFRGTRAWILICAVFIASLGLNTNSIAVIIGAMLISPLMGPIIGLGLGLGITDFKLVRKSLRNFAISTLLAIATSALYFIISPISTAHSELLARTQPTTYDVLIAFFGGLAGVIAGSSKYKGNVIPGVAIATALMPPLCTAGYGIATGQLNFFVGAFYLYLINSVFIGLATFLMIRLMNYPRKSFVDPARAKRLNMLVVVIVISTMVPSIFLGYRLIQHDYFVQQEHKFMEREFNFPNSQVIRHSISRDGKQKIINVTMIGEELPESVLQSLSAKLPEYGLRNVSLNIRQGFGNSPLDPHTASQPSFDFMRMQQVQIDSLRNELQNREAIFTSAQELSKVISEIFPEITRTELGKSYGVNSTDKSMDTLYTISLYSAQALKEDNQKRIESWLSGRYPKSTIHFNVQDK